MKTKLKRCSRFIVLALLATLNFQPPTTFAQGTAFTYQGRLNAGTNPVTGTYDLTFTLYNAATGGSVLAGPVTNTTVPITNGLFTVMVNFGAGVFTGSSDWLGIGVRINGSGAAFSSLSPLQQVTPTPYAIFAEGANAAGLSGAIPADDLSGVNGGGLTNLNASQLTSGTIPLAQLPAAVVTNDAASLIVGGTNAVAPLTVPTTAPAAACGSVSNGGGSGPFSVAVAGRYAYVANWGSNTLQIIDVSIPSAPVSVGSVSTGSDPESVAVAGRYAYVVNWGSDTLQVFDVSTPSAPVLVGSVSTGGASDSVAVAGRYAYVVNAAGGLQIFDVGTPSAPVSIGSLNTGGVSIAVAGRYAYVVNYAASTLQIIDVSSPSAPVSVGSVGTGSNPYSVAVAGSYAYVANNGSNTLQVFDVSTPSAPVSVGWVGTGSQPHSVAVAGRYAYVVNFGASTLQIFDVSTPSAPVSIGSVGTGNSPFSVAVAGRYAYVANKSAGTLQVFDLGGACIQQLEAGAMETGTLQTRDAVTVGNNLNVRGGLTVSASARISGGLSVDNGTITATNFSGNGGGLTNLNVSAAQVAGVNGNFIIGGGSMNGSDNTADGYLALLVNTSGGGNTANGVNALMWNQSGSYNTADGLNALMWNSGGGGNTADGVEALYNNATGNNNTAAGTDALYANTSGSNNVALGVDALDGNTSGNGNIGLGYKAGYFISGNNNIDIGNPGATSDNNVIRIGNGQAQTFLSSAEVGITGGLNIDQTGTYGQNNGTVTNSALTFGTGPGGSGEGIASQRTSGANQFDLTLFTGFNPRLTILSSGNVGIGTTNPASQLEVNGAMRTDGNPLYLLPSTSDYPNDGLYWASAGIVGINWFAGPWLAGFEGGALGTLNPNTIALNWDWMGDVCVSNRLSAGSLGINTQYPSQAVEVNGNYVLIDGGNAANGSGPIDAYIGGDGSGSGVQIGSMNANITGVKFWNHNGTVGWMSISSSSITIEGGSDLAEPFKITSDNGEVPQGAVVVIDEQNPGRLKMSDQSYDTRVAGVVSGANGINPGIQMQQQGLLEGGKNVALTGRVYVRADNSNGPIKPGDLLTTSSTPGRAMKVTDHARAVGAILGKAMTGLGDGQGMVLVLVTLQ